ncbi:glycosyltransferase family 4 protein [archaeon]|jgi:L-malate glycosyltransferase|nr:glycosyltransferase family 4 protein [archaeon]MBT4396846.1 glycosyltransferase family 4 protein [archaeon]MBT4441476.1 glycosyltransferase family 4 protein [archaeon]
MKVLIIARTYIDPNTGLHEQLDILSKYKNIDLHLLVPSKYERTLKTFSINRKTFANKNYTAHLTNLIFLKKESALFFFSPLLKYLLNINPDVIHVEEEPYSLFSFQLMTLTKIFLPKTKIITFSWENIYYKKRPFPLSFFENFSLNAADYALPGNQDALNILRKKGFKKPMKIVPRYGINLNYFKKTPIKKLKSKLKLKGKIIGFIGRLVVDKGIDTLMKAASLLDQEYTLVIIGRGPEKKNLIKYAKKLGILDNIRFIDTVEYSSIPQYMSTFDAFVLPSRSMPKWKEQFGHVIIEAMACEIPVIGSDSGEIPHVIAKAGLVFKENDYTELHDKLKTSFKPNIKKSLIKKGLKRVKDFSQEKTMQQFYETYKEVLKK